MPRKISELPFYIGDDLVGKLLRDRDGRLSFAYDSAWKGDAISPVLPIGKEIPEEKVYNWFRELMPEDRRRHAFEHMTRLSLQRIREFLFFFGEELPGDLSVKPASEGRSPEDITYLIESNLAAGGSMDRVTMGTSLGGCEAKASVRASFEDGRVRFFSATSRHPSTHIIKASGAISFVEQLTMGLAGECGLFPVSKISPLAIQKIPFLLVERYDRAKNENGELIKLAQEDFCQALGNRKRYGSEDGGIGMPEMAEVIRTRLPEGDGMNFLRMSFFSMYVGNSDDHAGNYALLKGVDGWELAPAYDIVSVAVLKELAKKRMLLSTFMLCDLPLEQARKFGEHYDAMEIDSRDIEKMCAVFRVSREKMREAAEECHTAIMDALDGAFAAGMKESWKGVKLNQGMRRLCDASIRIFPSVVSERTWAVWRHLDKAFRQKLSASSRMRL